MKRALLSLSLLIAAFFTKAVLADSAGLIDPLGDIGASAQGLKNSRAANASKYEFAPSLRAEFDTVDLAAGRSGTGLSTSRGFALTKGQSLLGIGTLPINESFSFFGQFGLLRNDENLQFSLGVPAYKYDARTDLTYGVGLKYDFTERLGLRFQWERMNNSAAEAPGGDSNVNLLSTGLRYRF